MPYEIGRLAQDLAGGLMVTMPSEKELESEETGALLRKYLKGRADIPAETRMRILRLIENMTLGRNAVGYLTESMHGAGSPQAQRIQIARQMDLDYKKQLARRHRRGRGRAGRRGVFRARLRDLGSRVPDVRHPEARSPASSLRPPGNRARMGH